MKLSEIKGEQAFDVLEEILEPIAQIASDAEVPKITRTQGKTRLDLVRYIIKAHKKSIISILASLERKSYDDYLADLDLFKLPMQIMDVINDEQVQALFQSQSQNKTETSFGSATENTEAHAE